MAVYHTIPGADVSFVAAVNLSSCQYFFVQAGSVAGEVTGATGASNPAPLGVLQNSPSAGQEARVRLVGPTKVKAVTGSSCGIAYGRFILSTAAGEANSPATENGSPICGRWIGKSVPVSASRYGEAFLFGFSACHVSAC